MKELPAIVRAVQDPRHLPAALATLVTVEGSSYRRPGARLLLSATALRLGSISGGCLEEDVLARARRVLATGIAECVVYDTTTENDLVWGVGLGCHGIVRVVIERLDGHCRWAQTTAANLDARRATSLAVVHAADDPAVLGTYLEADLPPAFAGARIFHETVSPPPSLYVFGAGDDAQPVVRFAKELGWHVTVADPRAAFANRERFPAADAVVTAPAPALVDQINPEADALAVVMTHHYIHDVPLLEALLRRPLRYVGLLGPRKRADKIIADLAANQRTLSAAERQRLHAPIGLDLGADGPESVALSIISEIQAVLEGRDARPLRERVRPIHG